MPTATHRPSAEEVAAAERTSMLRQPPAVWATALASVFAFMGIGLVDPILPAIAENLNATHSQVSLLFTSYFALTAVMMLVTGWLSSRIGGKRTLLLGLALVAVFAALSGTSSTVDQLVGFRAGWGLGNALFVATALAVIVAVASGGSSVAIILYEAALGAGLSLGPLLGAVLGGWHWRAPFFGTAVLMTAAFVALLVLLPDLPRPAQRTRLSDPLRALGHGGLRIVSTSGALYYYGFFTVLAFVPFVLDAGPYTIGAVFFGWGLALALTSVFLAPVLQARWGTARTLVTVLVLLAADLGVTAAAAAGGSRAVVIACTVAAGALLGVNNTLYTELAMEVSDAPRPVASAGYNCVRWMGGVVAPYVSTLVAERAGVAWPFVIAAVVVLVAAGLIGRGARWIGGHEPAVV